MTKNVNSKNKPLLGLIGQGFVGKAYADEFENRDFSVVRYSLEEPYIKNKDKIKDCDIVFIAVPTPTTENGFDDRIVRSSMGLIGDGKSAVIKSTILPGTTESIQKENPDIFIFHSPEFLVEANASEDTAKPVRNIVGLGADTAEHKKRAEIILSVLPKAPYELICSSAEAELIKYAGNTWLYLRVIFANLLYDVSKSNNINFEIVREALGADPRIGKSHLNPVHQKGRGAGGHCLIKDFAAFSELYKKMPGDNFGVQVLDSLRDKNIDLLLSSGKDFDLLKGVYGDEFLKQYKKSK